MRLLIPALLFLAACARTVTVTPGTEEIGAASWYGHPYHGRRTASGEIYDMNDLTAAHRSLPLGTRLLVTNLDTGQAVEVRVNDRGPLTEERILDLSYAAARVIGADRVGVIPVRLKNPRPWQCRRCRRAGVIARRPAARRVRRSSGRLRQPSAGRELARRADPGW